MSDKPGMIFKWFYLIIPGIAVRDEGLIIGGVSLKDARPGDIIMSPSRVVPLPDPEAVDLPSMAEVIVEIEG